MMTQSLLPMHLSMMARGSFFPLMATPANTNTSTRQAASRSHPRTASWYALPCGLFRAMTDTRVLLGLGGAHAAAGLALAAVAAAQRAPALQVVVPVVSAASGIGAVVLALRAPPLLRPRLLAGFGGSQALVLALALAAMWVWGSSVVSAVPFALAALSLLELLAAGLWSAGQEAPDLAGGGFLRIRGTFALLGAAAAFAGLAEAAQGRAGPPLAVFACKLAQVLVSLGAAARLAAGRGVGPPLAPGSAADLRAGISAAHLACLVAWTVGAAAALMRKGTAFQGPWVAVFVVVELSVVEALVLALGEGLVWRQGGGGGCLEFPVEESPSATCLTAFHVHGAALVVPGAVAVGQWLFAADLPPLTNEAAYVLLSHAFTLAAAALALAALEAEQPGRPGQALAPRLCAVAALAGLALQLFGAWLAARSDLGSLMGRLALASTATFWELFLCCLCVLFVQLSRHTVQVRTECT